MDSVSATGERAVSGVTSGLLDPGDEVTWEAVHFGVRQRLTSRITEFDRPRRFVDEMVRGAFRRLRHVHEFQSLGDETLMTDEFDYASPLGILGRLADVLFLETYMTKLLGRRNTRLKELAESGGREGGGGT